MWNEAQMSVVGHKQTPRAAISMSALPPKADILAAVRYD